MARLPSWCNTEARQLLARLAANPPECIMARRYADMPKQIRFLGEDMRAVRRIWQHACNTALESGDREAWIAVLNEHPDDILYRMLPVEDCGPDPLPKRRAA